MLDINLAEFSNRPLFSPVGINRATISRAQHPKKANLSDLPASL